MTQRNINGDFASTEVRAGKQISIFYLFIMTNHYIGCDCAASATAKIEVFNDYFNEYVSRYFYDDAEQAINQYRHSTRPEDRFFLKDEDTHKWVEVEVIC